MAPKIKRPTKTKSPRPQVTKTKNKNKSKPQTIPKTSSNASKFVFRLCAGNPMKLQCGKTSLLVSVLEPKAAPNFFNNNRLGNFVGGAFMNGWASFCSGKHVFVINVGEKKPGGWGSSKSLCYSSLDGNPMNEAFHGKTVGTFSRDAMVGLFAEITSLEEEVRIVGISESFSDLFLRVYSNTYATAAKILHADKISLSISKDKLVRLIMEAVMAKVFGRAPNV